MAFVNELGFFAREEFMDHLVIGDPTKPNSKPQPLGLGLDMVKFNLQLAQPV